MTPPPRLPTDALVRALTRDLTPVRRLRGANTRAASWAALAAVITALATLAVGTRPDLSSRLSECSYVAESAALLTLFAAAARSTFRLSIPGLVPASLPAIAPAALAIWILHVAHRASGGVELAAVSCVSGLPCLARILALALVPTAIGVRMLRRAAPQHHGWTGLGLALAAGSLAVLGTQAICPRDAAEHVLAWHVVPVIAAALVGGALGRRLLCARPANGSHRWKSPRDSG
jgi:hypothetical protein